MKKNPRPFYEVDGGGGQMTFDDLGKIMLVIQFIFILVETFVEACLKE